MNEGWASYWHSKIMTRHGLTDAELIDYADHHSGTMATSPGRLNPYKLGIELFKDIEDRWNKGKFGPEYDACTDTRERARWNTGLGAGRQKIFEVRRVHNDVTFIDAFLTPEFCVEQKLFRFQHNDTTNQYEIASREFPAIKAQLLDSLTNHGRPFIHVVDGNHRNRGELLLSHLDQGIELRRDYARDVLINLEHLWSRPVAIETHVDGQGVLLAWDGATFETR
jgi:stage V sporulation protein R